MSLSATESEERSAPSEPSLIKSTATQEMSQAAAAPTVPTTVAVQDAPPLTDAKFANLATEDPWMSVQRAHARILPHLPRTMLRPGRPLPGTAVRVHYKYDHLRATGSYKERGALNAILTLTPEQARRGVIAASAGNHAAALALHGARNNVEVTVVMPRGAPITKVENCKTLGANVQLFGRNFAEAKAFAEKLAKERGLTYVNGYDHPEVIFGAGTCGLEILQQLPDVKAIVVPVGGGGLIAGIALAVKRMRPDVRIIGVESDRCPSMCAALRAGKPVMTEVAAGGTIADGLAVSVVGTNALVLVRQFVDEVITVPERFISMAILHLLEQEKILVEGAGCAGLAAVLSGQFDSTLTGEKVVTVLCGGNIDMTVLGRVIERGLFTTGRLLHFDCAISDSVGGLARFLTNLAQCGASVKDISQERAFMQDMSVASVHVTCETMGPSHREAVLREMAEKGYILKVVDDMKYADVPLAKL